LAKEKRIEIRIQTDRRVVIYATGLGCTWCERCHAEREAVGWQTAGLLAEALMLDWPKAALQNEIHIFPSKDGSTPRVCLESLLKFSGGESKVSETSVLNGLPP
jgi:hypothetical protein